MHGVKFIDEHPDFKELLYKLYIERELDDWYLEKCKATINLPKKIYNLNSAIDVEIRDRNWPSIDMYIKLQDVKGKGNFQLEQEIEIRVSKILPLYSISYGYEVRHETLQEKLSLDGSPQTLDMLNAQTEISSIFQKNGYIELSYIYDLHDTVFEWHELDGIEPFNRRLTLEDAIFTDTLELCD